VRPGRASQSGHAATARMASAHDGSMTPTVTQVSSWRSKALPLSRSPRYGTASSPSAVPRPATGTAVSTCRAGAETSAPKPVSGPSRPETRIRWCNDASPSRATDTAACLEVSPASMSLRKCVR